MNILLLGYYGFHNFGDDLMLEGLTELLVQDTSIDKIVIPVRESYYQPLPLVEYKLLPVSFIGWIKLVWSSHHIIWGGGTCLYANSGLFWLFLITLWARMLGKKISFLSIGVEVAASRKYNMIIRMILRMAHLVSLRDRQSMQVVREVYNANMTKIIHSYDLVYLSMTKLLRQKQKKEFILNRVSFSGHYAFISREDMEVYACIFTEMLERHPNITIHFLPAHEGITTDNIQHQIIASYIPERYKNRIYFYQNMSSSQYIEQMATMDFHMGFRLHSIFVAEYLNIPYLAIVYAPKVRIFANEHGRCCVNVGEMVSYEAIENILANFTPHENCDQHFEHILNNIKGCIKKVLH